MTHTELFWKEYEEGENLQLAAIKFIKRHRLNEERSLTLIENIKNEMEQVRKSMEAEG